MIPPRLLPHMVTVTTPARTSDAYGNEILDYEAGSSRELRGYVQPQTGGEETVDRNAVSRQYLLFTNEEVAALDRVTWDGRTFEVQGPSRDWDTPSGAHHHETLLTLVEG